MLPDQWASTFRLHAAPLLDKPVDRSTSADVLGSLAPIWKSKPTAAAKARNRIAAVFWCVGRNYRPDNPVDRAVVALPRASGGATEHFAVPLSAGALDVLGRVRKLSGMSPFVFPSRAESGVPAEVAEACLAHVPNSRGVQAYQRSDLLERRAEVLRAWGDYLTQ